jgi:hypothetical protein
MVRLTTVFIGVSRKIITKLGTLIDSPDPDQTPVMEILGVILIEFQAGTAWGGRGGIVRVMGFQLNKRWINQGHWKMIKIGRHIKYGKED